MKKIVFILLSFFLTLSCHAIPLFPFFVDLVGNYKDGLVEELQPLEIECLCSDKCNDFSTIEAAESFLDEVLPYENYPIIKKSVQKNGINMQIYASPMEDNKTSLFCLVELPGEGLYVTYNETPGNPLLIE